ncbi:MAG: hypothetical protein NTU57_04760 [Candidatus Aenigmarchaeota archaeon]|nr:hypothetical protein [Candidatus Aenigmarchaeota archaeon]
MKLMLLLLAGLILISGCTQQTSQGTQQIFETAKGKCIYICTTISSDMSDRSPCLSDNNPEWGISDWVCDVAHSPRQTIDDLPENQCLEFREGNAHHFIEVDPGCEFIRAM